MNDKKFEELQEKTFCLRPILKDHTTIKNAYIVNDRFLSYCTNDEFESIGLNSLQSGDLVLCEVEQCLK